MLQMTLDGALLLHVAAVAVKACRLLHVLTVRLCQDYEASNC